MQTLKIGILGLGNIGSGVFSLIRRKRQALANEQGVRIDVVKVGDRGKRFDISFNRKLLTANLFSIVRDPSIDVIVELIGGVHPACELVMESFRRGKDVVTANKALLAEKGDEIFRAAEKFGRDIYFEASVGGGIPVIQGLREGLCINSVQSIRAIINGTSNYILSRMSDDGISFQEALRQAQEKGFAERNPSFDVDGTDAAHKLVVLAGLAFGKIPRLKDINVEGISRISAADIAFAKEFGYRIKLLAILKKSANGIEARVQPTLLPKDHQLSNVNGSFNGILIRADEVGDIFFYGRGAGQRPTSSAVVSDLIQIAKVRNSMKSGSFRLPAGRLAVKSMSAILSRYYLRFHVVDRPGVLATISDILGKHAISISDVIQKEWRIGSVVPLILLTHDAKEDKIRHAIRAIDRLRVIRGKTQVLRIES